MSFTLRLSDDETALVVYDRRGGRAEVRGAPGYTRTHVPGDPLHEVLDALDPATVSVLFTYEAIRLNPNNTRQAPSFATCERVLRE